MNWKEEIFQIVNRRIPRTPVVYEVRDLLERPIEGTFYEKELQKVERPDIFRVEKVLKKRIRNNKEEYLVRWSGYDSDFYSWLDAPINCFHQCPEGGQTPGELKKCEFTLSNSPPKGEKL